MLSAIRIVTSFGGQSEIVEWYVCIHKAVFVMYILITVYWVLLRALKTALDRFLI